MMDKWKTLKKTVIFDSPYKKFCVDQIERQDGKRAEYAYHQNRNAVGVFLQRDDEKLVMIREYRYLFDRDSVSHVQGAMEEGEEPEETARREAQEETGYAAGTLVGLGEIGMAPAISKETMHLFLARDLTQGVQNPDENEKIALVAMSEGEIDAAIRSGEIWDAQVIASWLKLRLYLQEERR